MPGPFTKNVTVYRTLLGGASLPVQTDVATWYTSGKGPDGKLLLTPQLYSRTKQQNITYWQAPNIHGIYMTPSPVGVGQLTTGEAQITKAREGLYNQAYAKFWGKVKGDTAALGISIGTWRQSWKMIDRSYDRLYSLAKDAALEARRRNRRGGRLKRERAADVFLEWKFGWEPLLQDIVNSMSVLTRDKPSGWYRASASCQESFPDIVAATVSETNRLAHLRRTLSAKVDVSNPNLWLANQLGLVNLAAIGWDRIPWSFLVGAFANVGQILASFTNEFGLTVTGFSDTTTTRLQASIWMANNYPKNHVFYAQARSTAFQVYKARSLGSFTRPHFQVRLPDLDMTKALIASALFGQQLSKLGRPSRG